MKDVKLPLTVDFDLEMLLFSFSFRFVQKLEIITEAIRPIWKNHRMKLQLKALSSKCVAAIGLKPGPCGWF